MTNAVASSLAQFRSLSPAAAALVDQMVEAFDRKLWHQLTELVDALVELPELSRASRDQQPPLLVQLYSGFLKGLETKMNSLRLAFVAALAAEQISAPAEALEFLQRCKSDLVESSYAKKLKDGNTEQANVVLRAAIGKCKVLQGEKKEARTELEGAKSDLDALPSASVDPAVFSSYYKAHYEYLKAVGPAHEFYRTAMLYIAYTPVDRMPLDTQRTLSFDIGIAALVGEGIYNFGELLTHPVVDSLKTSPQTAWLGELLQAFHQGNISEYGRLVSVHQTHMERLPVLLSSAKALKDKIQLMSLVELVFSRFPAQRTFSFKDVAQQTGEPLEGVERLLMRALALNLIRGRLDQVDQTVLVNWVQPRVLDKTQIAQVYEKFDSWIKTVHHQLVFLEKETPDIVAQ